MENSNEPLFLPASFFMVRAPVLPIEDFYRSLDENNLKDSLFSLFKANARFRQAIFIASHDLYEAMLHLSEKSEKEKEQLKSSLLKYFIRMCSRCTPFGLFSFVALGKWEDTTKSHFDQTKLQKKARVDMEWLIKVIDSIVENPDLFHSLPVMANPLLTQTNGRFYLSYIRKKTKEEQKKTISIRSNFLTSAIVKFADSAITVDELEKKLFSEFPTIDKLKTRGVIKQLVEQQILISSLYPSLLTYSTFDDLLTKIEHLKIKTDKYESLLKIQQEIESYNNAPLGQGEDILSTIYQLMEKIAKVQNYLQVDLGYNKELFSLPFNIRDDISEACEVVWKLSTIENNQEPLLKDYHEKFLEKYGFSRRVPLLELLDEDGLGTPDHYLNSRKQDAVKRLNKWKKWLLNERNLCLHERRKEIVITEQLVEQFFDKSVEKSQAPLSFDVLCNIISETPEKLDQGEYKINLTTFSPQAGNFFGRFIDLLGTETQRCMKELYLAEEALDKECLFIETSYFPLSARSANVATHPNLRSSHLDLAHSGNNSIKINEIYVGANDSGFYLTNRNGDKEWVFRSGNMLTLEISPVPVRFLRDVSLNKHRMIRSYYWNEMSESPFLPRISYKKMILSPAQWTIDLSMLEANEKSTLLMIEERVKIWMDRWEMPRYFFLTEADNQILLDRENVAHRKEIAQKIKSQQMVNLVEKIDQNNGSNWIHSPLGTHLNEIVIPCTINPKFSNPKPLSSIPKVFDIPQIIRRKGAGSEWLYLKIYLSQDNHERFLSNHLLGLTTHLLEQDVIKQWFFIRYQDKEGSHLRVRFHGEKEKLITMLPTIHDWSNALFEERFIQNISLATYEREIERYGGEKLIEAVEAFFCTDTLTTIELLKILTRKETELPNYVVAAISLLDLAKQFSPVLNTPVGISISTDEDKSELKGIREWKKILCDFSDAIFEHNVSTQSEYPLFQIAFQKRKDQISQVVQMIQELQANRELGVSIESIYHSIVHMHCNRLMGIDQNLEKKARLYANYALTSKKNEISVSKEK